METFLFIWAIVAAAGSNIHYGWKNMGEFETLTACERAAEKLGIANNNFRCVRKG